MKKSLYAAASIALAAALIWFVWLRSPVPGEEAPVPTEVAVKVGKIARATLRGYVTAYGTVEPQPPGVRRGAGAVISPSVPGVITLVRCTEGERVALGDLLFQLDSRAADVAADKAREAADYAEKNYERQKKLIAVEGTSQKLLLEAQQALDAARSDLAAARTQQALLRVTAPIAGTVARIHVKPGEAVDLSTRMADLVDLDRLVVSAGVPIAELPPLKIGQAVEVTGGESREPLAGSLTTIGAEVDPRTGTALVRAAVPARSDLRPGEFVALRIVTQEHRDCLAVPEEAVVKNAEGATVIALVRDGRAIQTPVKTGLRDGHLVEIEGEGLAADATVVTEGAYALPSETKIRVLGR
jgi:membrane fusion protein, multidrug efflux system